MSATSVPGGLAGKDVAGVFDVAGGRDVGERRLGHAEVLGQYVFGRVREPVRDQKGFVFREVSIVEHQKEFALLQRLDRMWKSGPEIPQVAAADVVDEVAALGVDGGDAGAAGQHERPLSFFVPVQLSVCSGIQPHVHRGQGGGDRQLPHRYLSGPTSCLETVVRRGEGEFQVRKAP